MEDYFKSITDPLQAAIDELKREVHSFQEDVVSLKLAINRNEERVQRDHTTFQQGQERLKKEQDEIRRIQISP